jgi:GT2 family glycosyltransferase
MSSPPIVDISVIVLTTDIEQDMLRECLDSVLASSQNGKLSTEIVLVDNASRSRVCDWVAHEFPLITVLRFESSVGFSTGNNAGYRISKGRYLLQLNNDTVIHPAALRTMVDFLDAHPDTGAVGPRLVNPDGTLQIGYYARAFPTITYNAFHLFWIHRLLPNNPSFRRQMLLDEPDVTREVDQPAGASLLYRRDVLFSLGLLDEDYIFAFDDVDVCSRIKRAGWTIYYVAEATVTHYGGASLNKSTAEMTHYYLNGLLTYYQKNSSTPTFFIMRLIVIAAILFRIPVIFLVTYGMGKKRWRGNIQNYLRFLLVVIRSLISGYSPHVLPRLTPTLIAQPAQTNM